MKEIVLIDGQETIIKPDEGQECRPLQWKPIALLFLGLSACATTPAQKATLTAGAQTLASVAAANNSTVASLVTKGTLFCQTVTATGPLVVALATVAGVPVSVIGQAASDVATGCGLIDGVAVVPPANPEAVPVVPVATSLPAVS